MSWYLVDLHRQIVFGCSTCSTCGHLLLWVIWKSITSSSLTFQASCFSFYIDLSSTTTIPADWPPPAPSFSKPSNTTTPLSILSTTISQISKLQIDTSPNPSSCSKPWRSKQTQLPSSSRLFSSSKLGVQCTEVNQASQDPSISLFLSFTQRREHLGELLHTEVVARGHHPSTVAWTGSGGLVGV